MNDKVNQFYFTMVMTVLFGILTKLSDGITVIFYMLISMTFAAISISLSSEIMKWGRWK